MFLHDVLSLTCKRIISKKIDNHHRFLSRNSKSIFPQNHLYIFDVVTSKIDSKTDCSAGNGSWLVEWRSTLTVCNYIRQLRRMVLIVRGWVGVEFGVGDIYISTPSRRTVQQDLQWKWDCYKQNYWNHKLQLFGFPLFQVFVIIPLAEKSTRHPTIWENPRALLEFNLNSIMNIFGS